MPSPSVLIILLGWNGEESRYDRLYRNDLLLPSKPLACYGDGGAMFTSDARLAERLRMIANHGQKVKYHHALVGCNSRLDTLQAARLRC